MRAFFRCVAEAVLENGVRGLVEMVPGGKFACDVAASAMRRYQAMQREQQLKADVEALAQASFDAARLAAVEAVNAAILDLPEGTIPDVEAVVSLEQFLTAMPEAARASLKRPEDPSGNSVPQGFSLRTSDDFLKLLPPRAPRFRPGMDLPGKSGWIVERLLGIGGFGEVWYARHTRMASLSGAVKFCLGQSGQDLIHEADLIDRVMTVGKHPHIVPLKDVHLEGATPWLLFEYIDGGNLTDWIHSLAGMSLEVRLQHVLTAMSQLTDAVGFFHGMNPPLVHRDLKPSNILLDRRTNQLRITDFGIGAVTARESLLQENRGETSRGGRLQTCMRGSHTPMYASPQQREGGDPDPRDDIHALGVIAYQMLTGHLNQGAGPDFADDLRDAGVSEELIGILGKCVAQKAERRPKDGSTLNGQMKAVLEAYLAKIEAIRLAKQRELEGEKFFQEGQRFEKGEGVEQNDTKAAEYYQLACDRGHVKAQAALGVMYSNGKGVPQDDDKALELYRIAAGQGDAGAQFCLGVSYHNGEGLPEDYAMALKWYHLSADQGNHNAKNNIGFMYHYGLGVTKDYEKALEWYRPSADQGNAAAQHNLGSMYRYGQGVKQNYEKAVEWYRLAADKGNAKAQYDLGSMYRDGQGLTQDYEKAVKWFCLAADQGNDMAQYHLGWMYEYGQGVSPDHKIAAKWYRLAADQGNDMAQYTLGVMYEYGEGVSQAHGMAVKWYRLAAAQGHTRAREALARLGVS